MLTYINNYLGYVVFQERILRDGSPQWFAHQADINRRYLIDRALTGIDYVLAKIDASSEEGAALIISILDRAQQGFTIPRSLTGFTDKVQNVERYVGNYFLAGMIADDNHFTLVGTRTPVDLETRMGLAYVTGEILTMHKRNRRHAANAEATHVGSLPPECFRREGGPIDSIWDGETTTLDVRSYDVAFFEGGSWADAFDSYEAVKLLIGVVNINASRGARIFRRNSDGANLITLTAARNLNAAGLIISVRKKDFGVTRQAFSSIEIGDVFQFTLMTGEGQSKGLLKVVADDSLGQYDLLALDSKPELVLTGNQVHLQLNRVKQPGLVMTDAESLVNYNAGRTGNFLQASEAFIDRYGRCFYAEDRNETWGQLMGVLPNETLSPEDEDDQNVLTMFLRYFNRGIYDDGVRVDIGHFPGLMRKLKRQAYQALLKVNKLRVPMPADMAVAGYAFFDTSVIRYINRRVTFDWASGVLPAQTAVLRTHGPAFVQGMTSMLRQPSGTPCELTSRAELVRNAYYLAEDNSPLLHLSTRGIRYDDWWADVLLPADLAELLDLYRRPGQADEDVMVPFCVFVLAIMGGGDFDDRILCLLGNLAEQVQEIAHAEIATYPHMAERPVSKDQAPAGADRYLRAADTSSLAARQLNMVRRACQPGMVGRVANAGYLLMTYRYMGIEIQTPIAAMLRYKELVVDAEKKGGGKINLGHFEELIQQFYQEIVDRDLPLPKFLGVPPSVARLFNKAGKTPTMMENNPFDQQVDRVKSIVNQLFTELDRGFGLETRLERGNSFMGTERPLTTLKAYPVSKTAQAVAQSLRTAFAELCHEVNEEIAETIQLPVNPTAAQKADYEEQVGRYRFERMKAFDASLAGRFDSQEDPTFGAQVALALYAIIRHTRRVKNTLSADGQRQYEPIRDGQLFLPEMGKLFLAGLELAYAPAGPVSPEPAVAATVTTPELIEDAPQVTEPEPVMGLASETRTEYFTLVAGIKGKSDDEAARFQAAASENAQVDLHVFHAENPEDMLALWQKYPQLEAEGRIETAILASLNGTDYAFIPREKERRTQQPEIARFLQYAGGQSNFTGMLLPFLRNGERQRNVVRVAVTFQNGEVA